MLVRDKHGQVRRLCPKDPVGSVFLTQGNWGVEKATFFLIFQVNVRLLAQWVKDPAPSLYRVREYLPHEVNCQRCLFKSAEG